ncbi:MAG: YceI family protein [Bacteroidetes bacterium]|nr:YceI family protein [Fibrella sp.]
MRPTNHHLYGLTLLAAVLLTSLTPPAAPRKVVADKRTSMVSYTMKHAIHKWDAVSRDVNCAMNFNEETKRIEGVAVSMKVASFDSENASRDSHGLEVMESLKYPNVTFVSQDVQTDAEGKLTIKGTLTFHGVAKPIVVQATRKDAASQLTVVGGFDVSLTAHNVERPSFLGIKTDDTMNMKFTIVFPM